jgi:FKBP-type peptidyl-prolyl cis-trans isomerase 2
MHTAKLGDRVRIQYFRLSGQSATPKKPPVPKVIEFTAGSREVMPGLSLGVVGMTQGDQKRFTFEPAQAYGPVQAGLIKEIPRQRIPQHLVLHIGKRLTALIGATRRRRRVRVVAIKPDSVIVDGNHRLAGKEITLEVTLISVDSSAYANRSKPQFDMGGES